ncbi:MAG: outer membrane protein transport protein [Bordetella sp.]
MKSNQKLKQLAVAVSLSVVGASAFATNGYFPHGIGVKAKGMGGAAVAMTQDAFAGANNPAAAAFVGNRWDLGVDFFMPDRSATRSIPAMSMTTGTVKSSERTFPIPEFAYNLGLSEKVGVGISVYGNGGMNTTYRGASFACNTIPSGLGNAMCGSGNLGVDLMQLTIAPTAAYKVNENSSIGFSPLFLYQRFEAVGVDSFSFMTPSQGTSKLSNQGYDTSTGFGVRLGALSRVSQTVSVGASYSPKINMSKFKKYSELFASGGDFDIPSNWTVGAAIQVSPAIQVAIDYSAINYEDVKSVSNASSNTITSLFTAGTPNLGADAGSGFGWRNINVIKLGAQWQVNDKTILRVGYNKGDNPIRAEDVTFNILAPGVMEDHYTIGGTYKINDLSDWSWFAMYAPKVSVTGSSLFNRLNGLPENTIQETIEMKQYSFGLQYSKQF